MLACLGWRREPGEVVIPGRAGGQRLLMASNENLAVSFSHVTSTHQGQAQKEQLVQATPLPLPSSLPTWYSTITQ